MDSENNSQTAREATILGLIQKAVGVRLAHDAMIVGNQNNERQLNQRLVRLLQDKTFGIQSADTAAGSDMGITVGDQITNRYEQKGVSTAQTVATWLALALGGAGVGFALPAVLGAIGDDTPAAEQPAATDTDTQYILELVPDEQQ